MRKGLEENPGSLAVWFRAALLRPAQGKGRVTPSVLDGQDAPSSAAKSSIPLEARPRFCCRSFQAGAPVAPDAAAHQSARSPRRSTWSSETVRRAPSRCGSRR